MTSATNNHLPTTQLANAMVQSLAKNNKTQLEVNSPRAANYLARRAAHHWIYHHHSQPWSILIIDLLQRITHQTTVTKTHTATQSHPKIKTPSQLPTIEDKPTLLIAHIDQWSPRFIVDYATKVAIHHSHRTLLLVHNTPLR